jgi:hypothetical protein
LRITKAAITPGTQPQIHNKKVIKKEPQPLSNTANGGKIIAKMTRQILMVLYMNKSDNSNLFGVPIGRVVVKIVTLLLLNNL